MEKTDASLLLRQFIAMTRLSVKRYLRSRFFWAALVLGILPVLIAGVIAFTTITASGFAFTTPLTVPGATVDVQEMTQGFMFLVQYGYLNFCVFFLAVFFGNSALREESDEQTLHYLFLQPIPRWLIVAGKYAGFLLLAVHIFLGSLLLSQLLLLLPFGPKGMWEALVTNGRVVHLIQEGMVVSLAIAVWAAFFLAVSSVFRNMLYALFIYGWETTSNFLPETLRNFSLSYYFKFMLPERSLIKENGALGFMVEGPGGIQTFIVLTLVVCLGLTFAGWMTSTRECTYTDA